MKILLTFLLLTGLALAGSDGPLFPWPNVIGGALLILFTTLATSMKGALR